MTLLSMHSSLSRTGRPSLGQGCHSLEPDPPCSVEMSSVTKTRTKLDMKQPCSLMRRVVAIPPHDATSRTQQLARAESTNDHSLRPDQIVYSTRIQHSMEGIEKTLTDEFTGMTRTVEAAVSRLRAENQPGGLFTGRKIRMGVHYLDGSRRTAPAIEGPLLGDKDIVYAGILQTWVADECEAVQNGEGKKHGSGEQDDGGGKGVKMSGKMAQNYDASSVAKAGDHTNAVNVAVSGGARDLTPERFQQVWNDVRERSGGDDLDENGSKRKLLYRRKKGTKK